MPELNIQTALNQALQHFQAGRLGEAEAIYRQILRQDPNVPDALQMLGVVAFQVGQPDAAAQLIQAAIDRAPGVAEYHNNLGLVFMAQGKTDAAIELYERALALQPRFALAHNNLGAAQKQKGQIPAATQSFREALKLQPNYVEALNNLGTVLQETDQVKAAIDYYKSAIQISPQYAQAHNNLGNALKMEGRATEAIASYQQALAIAPSLSSSYINLGNTLVDVGRIDEAMQAYQRAQDLQPESAPMHSNRLFALHLLEQVDREKIFQEHLDWDRRYAQPLARFIQHHINDRAPARRLKIGYVSPDLREHSVSHFFQSLLAGHDPKSVEVFCYADLKRADDVTAAIQKLSHHWHDITALNDEQAATLIRSHQIDILVDLAGHTSNHRLLLFSRKPAPIQMTWLGYPDTTGLSAIDYRLTDAIADPPGSEKFHSEKLLRLPHGFLCFKPPSAPPARPLPAASNGYVTFGCFNGLAKINPPMIATWAQILKGVPKSRLMLKSRAFADPTAKQRIEALFAANGIASDRLELHGWIASRDQHLQLFDQIDIALDTFPYNGTTNTCEALWMGAAVVTLAGEHHASRVGASLLTTVGLSEFIATTPPDYIAAAQKLAGDLNALADLRRGLRERVRQSPLTDAPAFARDVEEAYRTAWKTWCGNPSSAK